MIKQTNIITTVILSLIVQHCCSMDQSHPSMASEHLQRFTFITETADTKSIPSNQKPGKWFDKTKPFEVLNAARGITKQSSALDTNMCEGWTIAIKDIPKLIKDCETIKGEEWHYMFDVWPCIIQGQLKQSGQSFKFEINAGSWMFVTGGDTTILLGSYKKENQKYFISKAWDGKE